MGSIVLGPIVPASAAFRRELRQHVPIGLVEALDRIGDQIEAEVVDPLLRAPSAEGLYGIFERVFPKFRDYYVSSVLIVWAGLREDPARFSDLTIRSFRQSEGLIRLHGARWIGQDAALNVLQGIATVSRMVKAGGVIPGGQGNADDQSTALIAYAMTLSAVLYALGALADGQTRSARLENVAALVDLSKSYAAKAYHYAKATGLLKPVRHTGGLVCSEEEDLVLAEAGLESYSEGLAQDDRP